MRVFRPGWDTRQHQFRLSQRLVSPARLTPIERRWRWLLLLGMVTFFLSGLAYSHGDFDITLPGCWLRELTGIPCPTFGMTRSVMAIARGRIWEAIGYHLFGPVILLGLATLTLHYAVELRLNRSIMTPYSTPVVRTRYAVLGIALYLMYYGIRMVYWWAIGHLATALAG